MPSSVSSSEEAGSSSRIPYHLKGKGKATAFDSNDGTRVEAGALQVDGSAGSGSWRSSLVTAAPSRPSSAAESSNVVRSDHDAPVVQPVVIDKTYGGTPWLASTLVVGNVHSHWFHHVHLNGSFYNVMVDAKMFPRAITPENVKNPIVLEKFSTAVEGVQQKLSKAGIRVPGPYLSGSEVLVVRDLDSPNGPTMFYLCYDRCLYIELFPKAHPNKDVLMESRTERFWAEVQAYPMHISQLPYNAEVDFLGALSYGSNERITEWSDTPFPFTDLQAQRLVKVYRGLKKELERGNYAVVPALTWHIARTMTRIESVRRQTNFGTADAKLYRPVVPKTPSVCVRAFEICLTVLLFGAHKMYRVRLQNARVQGTIYLTDFRELLGNFLAEWSDSNLLATVFVGANIAFLAVPDITNLQRNASLVSIVCSLVSVLTGVHHVWQHRTKVNASYDQAVAYLAHIQPLDDGRDSDLAITACFLSIPLVSLLYAVLSFSVAIAAFCIQNNDVHGKILVLVVLGVLGTAGLITFLFFWHVWRGPRTEEVSDEEIEEVLGYGWKSKIRSTTKSIARISACMTLLVCGRKSVTDEEKVE